MGYAIAIAGSLLASASTVLLILYYARAKVLMNRVLRIAIEDFHRDANAMMKTAEDIPTPILETLDMMNKLAFKRGLTRFLAKNAMTSKRAAPEEQVLERKREFETAFNEMRPELQALFLTVTKSWVEIILNRSPLATPFIWLLLTRMHGRDGRIPQNRKSDAIGILGLDSQFC
jgi:hypothetical protein